MKVLYPLFLCLLFTLFYSPAWSEEIAGWIEVAKLENFDTAFKAKLDTGARHSSLSAQNIHYFKKDGKEQVRFYASNNNAERIMIERPVVRKTIVKRHFGKSQQRPVILMDIRIGRITKKVEVNLVDRSGFNYQLLIGRSYLKGDLLIDSKRTFLLTKPNKIKSNKNKGKGE